MFYHVSNYIIFEVIPWRNATLWGFSVQYWDVANLLELNKTLSSPRYFRLFRQCNLRTTNCDVFFLLILKETPNENVNIMILVNLFSLRRSCLFSLPDFAGTWNPVTPQVFWAKPFKYGQAKAFHRGGGYLYWQVSARTFWLLSGRRWMVYFHSSPFRSYQPGSRNTTYQYYYYDAILKTIHSLYHVHFKMPNTLFVFIYVLR